MAESPNAQKVRGTKVGVLTLTSANFPFLYSLVTTFVRPISRVLNDRVHSIKQNIFKTIFHLNPLIKSSFYLEF